MFSPSNCEPCGLWQYSPCSRILGRGNCIDPKLVLIGEAPGPDEARIGTPFVGRAGKKLDSMIKTAYEAGIVYITNMVKCYPPVSTKNPTKGFRTPKEAEVTYCYPNLIEELNTLMGEPVIMTLGGVALYGICGRHNGITKELGVPRDIVIGTKKYKIIPNYHPSYVMRNSKKNEPEFRRVFEETYANLNL